MTGTTKESTMNIIDRGAANPARRSAVPWWAAFGAPLMGVPLLVGLLALAAPRAAQEAPVQTAPSSFTTDEVVDPVPEAAERMVELRLELVPEADELEHG